MNERDLKDMTILIEKMNKARLLNKKGMLTEEEYGDWVYYYYTLLTVTMESDGTLIHCPSCNAPTKNKRAVKCWNCNTVLRNIEEH